MHDMTAEDVQDKLPEFSRDWPVVVEIPTLDGTGGHVICPVRGIDALTLLVAGTFPNEERGFIRLRTV